MKNKAVIFTKDDAIILTNYEEKDLEEYAGDIILLNPDISHLRGVSPQFWKFGENDSILVMNEEEKKNRLEQLKLPKKAKEKEIVYIDREVIKEVLKEKIVDRPVYISNGMIEKVYINPKYKFIHGLLLGLCLGLLGLLV